MASLRVLHPVLLACAALCLGACDHPPASPVSPAATSPAATSPAPAAPASAAHESAGDHSAPSAAAPAAGGGAGTPAELVPLAEAVPEPEAVEERSGQTSNGLFVVSWVPVPDPLPFNEPYRLKVSVARVATPTVPETTARLELDATMPAHGHGMNRTPHVTANGDGTFLVEGMLFHMSGEWDLIFHVYVGNEYGRAILRVDLP